MFPTATPSRGKWTAWITTGAAGSEASGSDNVDTRISLLVCGTQGVAGPIVLFNAPLTTDKPSTDKGKDKNKEQDYEKKRDNYRFGATDKLEVYCAFNILYLGVKQTLRCHVIKCFHSRQRICILT